jgi:hypothetical protein
LLLAPVRFRVHSPGLLLEDSDRVFQRLQELASKHCRRPTSVPAPERRPIKIRRSRMLWTIFVILLILWILGFSFHVAGGLIHLLLVIAVIVLIINLITGRKAL